MKCHEHELRITRVLQNKLDCVFFAMDSSENLDEYLNSSEDEDFVFVFAQKLLSRVRTNAVADSGATGGSRLGKRPNINRFAEQGAARLVRDYFFRRPSLYK